jgi:hypothetical protein
MNIPKRQLWYEKIFITAFVIFILKNMLDSTSLIHMPGWVGILLILLPLLLTGYKLVMQSYSKAGFALVVLCIGICSYSIIRNKNYTLLYSCLSICALQHVDIRNVLKASIWTKAVVLIIHVVSYIILNYLRPEMIVYVYRNGARRHFFFLSHANLFTAYLVWMSLEFIYLNYDKLKLPHYIAIWLLNFAFYHFTDTNTGIILMIGVILLIYVVKQDWRITNKILSVVSRYIFLVFSVIFPLIAVIYTRLNGTLLTLWQNLNGLLSGRLLYGALGYDVYGFTLFGRIAHFPTKVLWKGYWLDGIVFDNSFFGFFIANGVIYLFLLSFAFYFLDRRTSQVEKVLIIAFVVYGIMEAYVSNIFICFPLVFIGKYIYMIKKPENIRISQEGESGYATGIQYSHSSL